MHRDTRSTAAAVSDRRAPSVALDIDSIICRVLNVGTPAASLVQTINLEEIVTLCDQAKFVLFQLPKL